MAEQIERNGAKFYRNAAESVSDPASKEFLIRLAKMEDAHEKTFAAMRTDLTDKEKATTTFDPQNEAVLYLRALADTRIFFEKEIDVTSLQEILKSPSRPKKTRLFFIWG
jgi:rubrerythrin